MRMKEAGAQFVLPTIGIKKLIDLPRIRRLASHSKRKR